MPFIELSTVDSTNNYALKQVHAGLAQHRMAVFAHEQVAGKGQRGKSWTTEPGSGIILSVLVDPHPISITRQFTFSASIAVAVCDFFRQYAGDEVRIKWPNDLYWRDRKAGGILIENVIGKRKTPGTTIHPGSHSGDWLWAVAGIGININQVSFPEALKNPVSLRQITGRRFDSVSLARELCTQLDMRFKQLAGGDFDNIYSSYLSNLYKRNERVKLKKGTRVFEALIKSISSTGQLIVEHGIEESFDFGEIEWVMEENESKK